jgi:hypothetical protein
MNSENDAGEYVQSKEKQRYEQLISDIHNRVENMSRERGKTLFFCRNSKETGNLVKKGEIPACLGSNHTLMYRKLNIQLQPRAYNLYYACF